MSIRIHPPLYFAMLALVVVALACSSERGISVPDPTGTPTTSIEPTKTLIPPPSATPQPTSTATPVPATVPPRTSAPTAVPGDANEFAAADIYAKVSPSMVSIHSLDGTGFLGTGFLIEGGHVVTNLHVVWPPIGEVSIVFPNGNQMNVPVTAWDPMSDIALLGPVNVTVPPLELRDGEDLVVGSELFLLGYPGESDPSPQPAIVSGLLSQIREWEPLGITYFQTDAEVAGGQSGGVLVNARGEVIGISGLRFTESNYALVASAASLKPIIQQLALGEGTSWVSNRELSLGERGLTFSGRLHNPWDTRTYMLTAASGEVIDLEIESQSPLCFKVTDATGDVILEGGNGSGGIARGSGKSLAGEYHFLSIDTPGRSAGEPVEFRLTSNLPVFPQNDPDDGRTIRRSGSASALIGSIDHFHDTDWYPFHLKEGETVRILASSANVDTVLLVDSPNFRVNQVTSDDDSGGGLFDTDSELVFRAPKAGEYYIVVRDFDGQSLGGYFLLVEQAPIGSEPVAVPPDPQEVDTPHGRMLVYESLFSDLSIQVPADWFQIWPDEEDSDITFQASSADGDAALMIFEFDLAAEGDFQTLEELAETLQAGLLGEAFEAHRENTVASSGDPAVVLYLQQRDGPGEAWLLTSLREERYAIFVAYLSMGDESLKSLAEYSFATLNSSGEEKAVRPTDRNALAALYNATDGENWQHNDGWLSDQPVGEWYGVVTNANGRVVGLHLDENRLSGEIPPELGHLSELELLYLSNNRLDGAIPPELGRLTNLTSLFLNGNDLTGEIPPALGNLTRLEILHLQYNNLNGDIPPELSNLARLRELDLGVNDLSGEIPPELGALGKLTSLWLGWNDLSGGIPPGLANLGSLTRLWVNNNRLDGCLPDGLASQLDDQSNVGNLQICGERPLTTSGQEDADESTADTLPSTRLAEYAVLKAGGPGAIYLGDLNQLVGPAPAKGLGDRNGNVPLWAIEKHSWLYDSDYYRSLMDRANLASPTKLTSRGEKITIRHACVNRRLLPCELLETYFVPNVTERTQGQVVFDVTSLVDRGISGPDSGKAIADGAVDSLTVYGLYLAGEIPEIDIQNLWGLYSSREQEFEATQAMLEDIEDLVLSETGGILLNHSWFAGNDQFLFCRERIDSTRDFIGKVTRTHNAAQGDWTNGMGATARFVAFAEVYDQLDRGGLDCAFTAADPAYGQRWYEVVDYMIGPLVSFPVHSNVINRGTWNSLPEDLQRILLEEAARSELEALRLAAIQFEQGVIENSEAGLELIPFSREIMAKSFETAVIDYVIPGWMRRMGQAAHSFVNRTFNPKVGLVVGLQIDPDGSVVKVSLEDSTETSE